MLGQNNGAPMGIGRMGIVVFSLDPGSSIGLRCSWYVRLAYRGCIDARVIDENTPPQMGMAGEHEACTFSKFKKDGQQKVIRYVLGVLFANHFLCIQTIGEYTLLC
jgi:hypothetical protein